MKLYEQIIELAATQGIAIAFSIVGIILIVVSVRIALKQYEKQKDLDRENAKADKELEREERKEDRAIQRQQMESLIEISSRSTQALEGFRRALDDSGKLIIKHDQSSSQKFDNIDCRFDNVDNQLAVLKDQVKDLAPKVMVDEVKKSIDGIRDSLKNTRG